jgi:ATP-dependent DNA helicase DinG
VEYLVEITQGRAFVLFTSWSNMNAAFELLEDKLPYTVFKQGTRPKSELLRAFKEDEHSVLFATSSFWEGVDVEGDALKLVIIDKLPFASPADPLNRARMDLLEARGKSSFNDFSVPGAALMLKQGFGRLIRSRSDTGVVAILDSRIATKRYGSHFIKSLPPAPVVWNASEVKRWWQDKFGEPEA